MRQSLITCVILLSLLGSLKTWGELQPLSREEMSDYTYQGTSLVLDSAMAFVPEEYQLPSFFESDITFTGKKEQTFTFFNWRKGELHVWTTLTIDIVEYDNVRLKNSNSPPFGDIRLENLEAKSHFIIQLNH